jgi:penicillin-binding protein 1A
MGGTGQLRVLGVRRSASGDHSVEDAQGDPPAPPRPRPTPRSRPRPTPPPRKRLKLALRIAKIITAVVAVLAAAIALLFSLTPSADQATAVAREQAAAHHIAYPGPPVPRYFAEALVATEDHRFYTDPGVDPFALGRVMVSRIIGRRDQGGSTIDQQLAKNLFTSGHSGFAQQIEQVVMAIKLNRAYSRPDILRLYAEIAYYGHGYYGLEAASCGYFGVRPARLTLVQAAMLAGAVNAPTYDDPLAYPVQARSRLVHVIGRMAAVGYLTRAQQAAALKAPLGLSPVRGCR